LHTHASTANVLFKVIPHIMYVQPQPIAITRYVRQVKQLTSPPLRSLAGALRTCALISRKTSGRL
jgi:hypothetical protein